MNLVINYGPGQSITLTRVQWSNTATLDHGLVSKGSRGGTQQQFKRNNYPQIETRHYTFKAIRLTTVNELRTLFTTNLGKIAVVTDDTGSYNATVFSDSIEVVATKDTCAYDFEIDILVVIS